MTIRDIVHTCDYILYFEDSNNEEWIVVVMVRVEPNQGIFIAFALGLIPVPTQNLYQSRLPHLKSACIRLHLRLQSHAANHSRLSFHQLHFSTLFSRSRYLKSRADSKSDNQSPFHRQERTLPVSGESRKPYQEFLNSWRAIQLQKRGEYIHLTLPIRVGGRSAHIHTGSFAFDIPRPNVSKQGHHHLCISLA